MIELVFKALVAFSVSFFLMAIPIDRRPLFYHMYRKAAPLTSSFYREVGVLIDGGVEGTSHFFRQLFTNADPIVKVENQLDQVQKRMAAPNRYSKPVNPMLKTTDEGGPWRIRSARPKVAPKPRTKVRPIQRSAIHDQHDEAGLKALLK